MGQEAEEVGSTAGPHPPPAAAAPQTPEAASSPQRLLSTAGLCKPSLIAVLCAAARHCVDCGCVGGSYCPCCGWWDKGSGGGSYPPVVGDGTAAMVGEALQVPAFMLICSIEQLYNSGSSGCTGLAQLHMTASCHRSYNLGSTRHGMVLQADE